jgi:hypothetical protein
MTQPPDDAALVAGDATHNWSEKWGMTLCMDCGIVRRRDRLNGRCKGKVKVGFRAALEPSDKGVGR